MFFFVVHVLVCNFWWKFSAATKNSLNRFLFPLTMNDVYYIIVTIIFGLFVLFMAWWLYRYLRAKPCPLDVKQEDLSDKQKTMLYKFCGEMRRQRLEKEAQSKKTSKKRNRKSS